MLFRQLCDPETSTYTYVLADERTGEAILIDSVREQFDRDCQLLGELNLKLLYTLETHVHADHITASGLFRDSYGSLVLASEASGVANADRLLREGDLVEFGSHVVVARATPGHTVGCMTFVCHEEGMAFTGDALLIRGCGRTDFQQGDPKVLYRSVHQRIFTLPEDTLLYPGHDYRGRTVSTIAEERRFNPRLGLDKNEADFASIMDELNLAYPKRIDEAVPANLESGLKRLGPTAVEDESAAPVAQVMEALGRQDSMHWDGGGI